MLQSQGLFPDLQPQEKPDLRQAMGLLALLAVNDPQKAAVTFASAGVPPPAPGEGLDFSGLQGTQIIPPSGLPASAVPAPGTQLPFPLPAATTPLPAPAPTPVLPAPAPTPVLSAPAATAPAAAAPEVDLSKILGAIQAPATPTASSAFAPAIAPPGGQPFSPNADVIQQLLQLLSAAQTGGTPSLGALIKG